MAIRSFRDRRTKAVFSGEIPKGISTVLCRQALRKLRLVQRARSLLDLRSPPGNRLEALTGDRAGQHSIRVNDQFRICFRWEASHAYEVELVDYH
jgi:proteic killer suppression protein